MISQSRRRPKPLKVVKAANKGVKQNTRLRRIHGTGKVKAHERGRLALVEQPKVLERCGNCGRELPPGTGRSCGECRLRDGGPAPSPEAILRARLQLRAAYGLAREEDDDESPEQERRRREAIEKAKRAALGEDDDE